MKKNKLPSRFQIGDFVSVKFKPWLVIDTAKVLKVHFTESNVLYDLKVVLYPNTEEECSTRIYNIDSAIVDEYQKD